MSTERGVIRNEARAKQLNNFKGLIRPRNITPTDIDGVIDYSGKYFIYIEGKMKGKLLSDEWGQKAALERIIQSHWKASNPSILILFEHNVPVSEQVDVSIQSVRMVYGMQKIPLLCDVKFKDTFWWFPPADVSVLQAVERFESFNNVFPNKDVIKTNVDFYEACISMSPNQTFERFSTLELAEKKYIEFINLCKLNNDKALVCLRSYKNANGTMIKNERL